MKLDLESNGVLKRTMMAQDLLHSELIGLWQDRSDIVDNVSYARQLRSQTQNRSQNRKRYPKMTTYQFSTQVTKYGDLPIPDQYLELIPPNTKVQITMVVESSPSETFPDPNEVEDRKPTLEEFVAYIRSHPLPPSLTTIVSSYFRAYFADSADPNFDKEAWNQKWKQIEAEMRVDEDADAGLTIKDIVRNLFA